MYRIEYSKNCLLKIELFINSYRNIFSKLFQDSGLIAEEEIVKNYIKTSQILRKKIFDNIETTAIEEKIFGRCITEDPKKHFTYNINSFKIFVYFSENQNIRKIEDIEFFRK